MEIRKLRPSLAILAAVLLVIVLSFLIIESRAVDAEYYVSHVERTRAIETTESDISAVLGEMQTAFDEGQGIPLSVELAFGRLIEKNQVLQNFTDDLRTNLEVLSQLNVVDYEIQRFVRDGQIFAKTQSILADALESVQEESPIAVKDLRERGLQSQSQRVFSLAIDIIEFATGQSGLDRGQLENRVEEFRNDSGFDIRAAGNINAFADAARSVIDGHSSAEMILADIRNNRVSGELAALTALILDDNRRTVSRAENAKILLSLCTVLLLLAAGYAMFRLQSSYRELNKINTQLEQSNITLEDRVFARTEQLSSAYDDLRESQVQLVQAEKMSSLGEMVAGISHEINTPLWYLMSNSSVIQERLDELSELCDIGESMLGAVESRSAVKESISRGLNDMRRLMNNGMKEDIDEAKDLIKDSIDGLEDLTALAQSLKDFSRLDRARKGEFNVNEGLDKTLLIVKNKFKNKASVHKHYGDVPLIHCSPSQINQIFLNLLTNAADAIVEKGEIVLHTWEQNGKVEICICDTGVGIPAEVLPKVRDPFFTTKNVGEGTGLGLSIVDQIVTAHEGELQIESVPGKGTIVTVSLPVAATTLVADDVRVDHVAAETIDLAAKIPDRKPGGLQDPVPEVMTA